MTGARWLLPLVIMTFSNHSASLLLFFPLQQSAERCVSTLLDLIQTKVNYVVQEAIVVIRDIFRKYPNKYAAKHGPPTRPFHRSL